MIGSFRLPVSLTSSGDTTAPTILTATVEDANPDKLVVVFSEVVTIANTTGLTITGAATPTLSAPTGSGTDTITFTLSTALTSGQSVTLNVASSNTIKDAANNALLATTKAITNNVAASATVDTDYQALLDYATANAIALPDATQQSIDNQLLIDYKATGAWAKDDCFMKFTGTATPAFKLIDWKRLITMVGYGSLTWSTTGAKGNGTNAYIDTKYIPSDAGNKWKANDMGVIIGISKMPTISAYVFGYRAVGGQFTTFHIDPTNSNEGSYILNDPFYGSIANASIIGLNGGYVDATNTTYIAGDTENKPTGTQFVPDGKVFLLAYHREGIAQLFTDAELDYVTFGADKRAEHAAMKTVLE